MGAYLLERAMELKEKHPSVGDVRGLGLFVGLELVKDRNTREPLVPLSSSLSAGMNPKLEVARRLGELGMMAMASNPGNTIGMAPPLIINKDEIDEGIAITRQLNSNPPRLPSQRSKSETCDSVYAKGPADRPKGTNNSLFLNYIRQELLKADVFD